MPGRDGDPRKAGRSRGGMAIPGNGRGQSHSCPHATCHGLAPSHTARGQPCLSPGHGTLRRTQRRSRPGTALGSHHPPPLSCSAFPLSSPIPKPPGFRGAATPGSLPPVAPTPRGVRQPEPFPTRGRRCRASATWGCSWGRARSRGWPRCTPSCCPASPVSKPSWTIWSRWRVPRVSGHTGHRGSTAGAGSGRAIT